LTRQRVGRRNSKGLYNPLGGKSGSVRKEKKKKGTKREGFFSY